MGRRSRISPLPLSWQLGVLLAITYLGWISEVSSLRTTPIIGKYSKERQERLRGPPAEVEVEEPIPEEVAPPPVRDPLISTYKVGIIAKSTASPLEGEEEGGNGTTKSPLTGIPQIDYLLDPNLPRELNGYNLTDYPFYVAVPEDINFKCDGLHDGFYASVPHKCQVYHHCLFGTRYDFLCANYTAFDQKTFICHFVSEVDCDNSPKYYKRNEALYKAATTTTTTTTTTTPAPTPAPQPPSQSSGGRVGSGGRRRRPARRRRPQYEYYDDDDYEDDYTEEDEVEYTRAPPRRRKKKPAATNRERPRNDDDEFLEEEEYPIRRRKQRPRTRPHSNRRPVEDDIEDDFEEDPPETSASGAGLVPVGTSASRGKGVFDKPRAPPKIRPPVPLNEREKYNYGRQGASGSTSGSSSQAAAKPARDDYEDEVVERRTKKRPTQPPPQSKGRDDYYEEEEEEEYERIPPPRGSFHNRRRKGQGSSRVKPTPEPEEEDDQYDYETREDTRSSDRYPTGGGRDRRKKRPPAAAASVPAKRRRPGYRREEEEYEYEDEEDTRVRPSSTRYKETYPKGRNDDDDYMERYPVRQPPSRAATEPPARKRVQPPLRSSESQDRPRPQSSVHNNRKRVPAPVHEEVDEDLSEEELEEEPEDIRPAPKGRTRGGERVRVVKHRITPLTTTTTTTKAPPPPPPTRAIPRTTTTPVPQHSRERDSLEDEEDEEGEYYESEEILEREPKTPEPPVSRRPFRPSAPINPNNGGSFAGSARSVPSSSQQSFLPRGLQALGDRAQKKEAIIPIVVSGTTSKPKPAIQVTVATTTTIAPSPATTKIYRKEEPKYPERPQSIPSPPQSYKQQTQYNGRQPTPRQEVQTPPQAPPLTRAPFVTNARPGYTTKGLPSTLYSQKPQQNTLPPLSPIDSVPNHTDYEEDDFINDALHPTIPSSSSFPVTAAASSLSTRHGISLSQQQRTTLSTPTQLSYRFRNAPQSSPIVDYRAQQSSNPNFSNRGVPLHTSASHQTLSFIQPPPFVSPSAPQSDLHHQQVSDSYQGSNSWTGPTRIVVY